MPTAAEVLAIYTLDEVLDINGLDQEDVLDFLVEQEWVVLPVVI